MSTQTLAHATLCAEPENQCLYNGIRSRGGWWLSRGSNELVGPYCVLDNAYLPYWYGASADTTQPHIADDESDDEIDWDGNPDAPSTETIDSHRPFKRAEQYVAHHSLELDIELTPEETPGDTRWNLRLVQLWHFLQQHGHLIVPYDQYPQLSNWVNTQRTARKYGRTVIKPSRITALDQLCFDWDKQQDSWDDGYVLLLAFKENYGHCNVPGRSMENKKLSRWVRVQRNYYKEGTLGQKRIALLNSVGFSWEMPKETYYVMLAERVEVYTSRSGQSIPLTAVDRAFSPKDAKAYRNYILTNRTLNTSEVQSVKFINDKLGPRAYWLSEFSYSIRQLRNQIYEWRKKGILENERLRLMRLATQHSKKSGALRSIPGLNSDAIIDIVFWAEQKIIEDPTLIDKINQAMEK